MEAGNILLRDEEMATSTSFDELKFSTNDAFACAICPYPVEILKISDDVNTVTFKYLNPKEKEAEKNIQIREYLDSMRKFTDLCTECSLCNKKKNEFKDISIFSYCIKCDTIICSSCLKKHLETNKKNHHGINERKYIIKNNEKSIRCLSHPIEKNIAFCLKCNTHICKECMKNHKHINHNKINLTEVLVTDEIKHMLNGIINIYKRRIEQLNKEKEKMKIELINEKENDKSKKENQTKNKIQEIQKELKKELAKNKKLLKDNIYKLKIKYENEVKLCISNFKILNKNINKKYEKLNADYKINLMRS